MLDSPQQSEQPVRRPQSREEVGQGPEEEATYHGHTAQFTSHLASQQASASYPGHQPYTPAISVTVSYSQDWLSLQQSLRNCRICAVNMKDTFLYNV